MRVISGGQTGVDRIGLMAARRSGLETGGTAPKGYMTEAGPDYSLKAFGLNEHTSPKYPPRTKQNIYDSDLTLLFTADPAETRENLQHIRGGSALTLRTCIAAGRPCHVNPTLAELYQILATNPKVINIAGTRGSKIPMGRESEIESVLRAAFEAHLKVSGRFRVIFDVHDGSPRVVNVLPIPEAVALRGGNAGEVVLPRACRTDLVVYYAQSVDEKMTDFTVVVIGEHELLPPAHQDMLEAHSWILGHSPCEAGDAGGFHPALFPPPVPVTNPAVEEIDPDPADGLLCFAVVVDRMGVIVEYLAI